MPDQDKPKDYDPTEAAKVTRRREAAAAWKAENAEAIRSHNERVEREGLLLVKYRRF